MTLRNRIQYKTPQFLSGKIHARLVFASRLKPMMLMTVVPVTITAWAIATGLLFIGAPSARADSHADSHLDLIEQGCDRLSGTFHTLGNGAWMCFYGEPLPQSDSLGIYRTQADDDYRLIVQQNADGKNVLALERIIHDHSTDD